MMQEAILQKNSICEKACDFSDIKEWCRKGLLEYFQPNLPNDSIYVTYFDNQSLIGVVECRFLENEGVYLEMIEVCKQYRNCGYGRRIIELIQADVKYIECVPKDSNVVFFYKKLGFERKMIL